MSTFENFIQDELPLRQVVIKASGDPTTGSGVIAAIGTYYLDTNDNFKRYEKFGSGNTEWREVPTAASSGGLSTQSITFADNSEISTIQVTGLSGTQIVDAFDTTSHNSCKYIINATTGSSIFCSEVLVTANTTDAFMTQYGTLGATSMLTINASLSANTLSLDVSTNESSVDVAILKFLLK